MIELLLILIDELRFLDVDLDFFFFFKLDRNLKVVVQVVRVVNDELTNNIYYRMHLDIVFHCKFMSDIIALSSICEK